MAWLIHSQIIRGEIDNRIRNVVTGRLWLVGRHNPVQIRLSGNAARDLAGRRLEIFNPEPVAGLSPAFASEQFGFVGEFTASRRVTVRAEPNRVLGALGFNGTGLQPRANGVYFEWFSQLNGHVIIESSSFLLKVDPDFSWGLSATEEALQRAHTAQITRRFLDRLGFSSGDESVSDLSSTGFEAPAKADFGQDYRESQPMDPHPMTEEEADALMDDSDRLAERLMQRLQAAGPDADIEAILAEELELRRNEEIQSSTQGESENDSSALREEMRARAEEILRDPDFKKMVRRRHPLADRASSLAVEILHELDHLSWNGGYTEKSAAVALATAISKAGGKLAGALDGKEWPPSVADTALCIAWLKRAQRYLGEASASAALCATQNIFSHDRLFSFRREISALKTEAANLIEELREYLNRGFD